MDADEPGWAMIDDVLRDLAVGRSAATTRRYLRVRVRLYAFLDTVDLEPVLGDGESLADDLVGCLPAFVREPWLPDGVAEARVHLSVVSRLVSRLAPEVAAGPTDAAVARAREALDGRVPDVLPARIPARLLQPPGPGW
jgi:hypothetical protein